MDARVGPALFPAVQVALRFLQAFEANPFQRCLFRMTDTRFHFALPVRVLNPAGHGDRAVMLQHVAVERVERGIVNIGREHALTEIIKHHDPSRATQPPKRFLV